MRDGELCAVWVPFGVLGNISSFPLYLPTPYPNARCPPFSALMLPMACVRHRPLTQT